MPLVQHLALLERLQVTFHIPEACVLAAWDRSTLQKALLANVCRVVWYRAGSITHSVNHDQRQIVSSFSRSGDRLFIEAPPDTTVAPPGYYTLTIVNHLDVPSEGKWVRLMPGAGAGRKRAPQKGSKPGAHPKAAKTIKHKLKGKTKATHPKAKKKKSHSLKPKPKRKITKRPKTTRRKSKTTRRRPKTTKLALRRNSKSTKRTHKITHKVVPHL